MVFTVFIKQSNGQIQYLFIDIVKMMTKDFTMLVIIANVIVWWAEYYVVNS